MIVGNIKTVSGELVQHCQALLYIKQPQEVTFIMIFTDRHGSQATSSRAQKRDAEATSDPRAVKRPKVLPCPIFHSGCLKFHSCEHEYRCLALQMANTLPQAIRKFP